MQVTILAYWLVVLKRAWGLLDRIELIVSLVAGAVAGTAAGLTPLPTWWIAPAFFAGPLVILLVMTPARIHREQLATIEALNNAIAPRLSVAVDKPRWRTDSKGVYVQLRVRNEGNEPLTGCYGKLLQIRRMTAAATAGWIPPEHEPHFLWARYQTGANELVATIPSDSSLFLSIATTDHEEGSGLFWFAFTEPLAHPLYIVHDLKIEIGSAVGKPVRRWYRITGSSSFDMTLEDIGGSDIPPPEIAAPMERSESTEPQSTGAQ